MICRSKLHFVGPNLDMAFGVQQLLSRGRRRTDCATAATRCSASRHVGDGRRARRAGVAPRGYSIVGTPRQRTATSLGPPATRLRPSHHRGPAGRNAIPWAVTRVGTRVLCNRTADARVGPRLATPPEACPMRRDAADTRLPSDRHASRPVTHRTSRDGARRSLAFTRLSSGATPRLRPTATASVRRDTRCPLGRTTWASPTTLSGTEAHAPLARAQVLFACRAPNGSIGAPAL